MTAQTEIRLVSGHTVTAAKVYSVTQLNQHCGEVMQEIARLGRPAAVTRHGKFVALITPLTDVDIESVVLSEGPLAREFDRYETEANLGDSLSAEDVEEQLDARGGAKSRQP